MYWDAWGYALNEQSRGEWWRNPSEKSLVNEIQTSSWIDEMVKRVAALSSRPEVDSVETYGAMSTMFAGYSREVRCADITRYSPERAPDRKVCCDQVLPILRVEVSRCGDGGAAGRGLN